MTVELVSMMGYGITCKPTTIKNMKPADVARHTQAVQTLMEHAQYTTITDIWENSKEVMRELVEPFSHYRVERGFSTASLLFKTAEHRYLLRVADKAIELRRPRHMTNKVEVIRTSTNGHQFMLVKDIVR